jgi:tRNA(fMet)-specific endonuclease VapC
MNLLLDTNILVYVARTTDTDSVMEFIAPGGANLYVSVVSVAEVRSLAIRNKWGTRTLKLIENFGTRLTLWKLRSCMLTSMPKLMPMLND